MNKNIVLCGVGGQGTVLASRLISAAAMEKNIPVLSAETIGMAQRGGSVFSHVRLGAGCWSPMIARGEADLILAFEPGEAVRMLPYLKPEGRMIVADRAVMPVTAALKEGIYQPEEMLRYLREKVPDAIILPAEKALREVGSSKVLNLVLLGAALRADALGLDREAFETAMRRLIPRKFLELNLQALGWAERVRS